VFSYIPNTAETAFFGMLEGLNDYLDSYKRKQLLANKDTLTEAFVKQVMSLKIRQEKIAVKDSKLRTFINEDASRDDMVAHVYDVTYGVVQVGRDTLVVLDDSIVRGNTLKKSIITKLDKLQPKRIVFVSSAPQIRYPDCYGIDMAKLGDFVAFQAAIQLLKESGRSEFIQQVYKKAKEQERKSRNDVDNVVKEIYSSFTDEQISTKVASMLVDLKTKAEVIIVYQTIQGLVDSIPHHTGIWYFSGDYPTPGGNQVVNRAFINYIEGRNERAY
jgi:amidophosphoribosyltransferase